MTVLTWPVSLLIHRSVIHLLFGEGSASVLWDQRLCILPPTRPSPGSGQAKPWLFAVSTPKWRGGTGGTGGFNGASFPYPGESDGCTRALFPCVFHRSRRANVIYLAWFTLSVNLVQRTRN